jgi:hypothetical protein
MNVTKLRRDIDAGRTGDKSPGMDSATAPLGTDDEAAGTPVDPRLAEDVRKREVRPGGEALSRQNATPSYKDTTPSDTLTPGAETLVRLCAAGTALALALSMVVWLLK